MGWSQDKKEREVGMPLGRYSRDKSSKNNGIKFGRKHILTGQIPRLPPLSHIRVLLSYIAAGSSSFSVLASISPSSFHRHCLT